MEIIMTQNEAAMTLKLPTASQHKHKNTAIALLIFGVLSSQSIASALMKLRMQRLLASKRTSQPFKTSCHNCSFVSCTRPRTDWVQSGAVRSQKASSIASRSCAFLSSSSMHRCTPFPVLGKSAHKFYSHNSMDDVSCDQSTITQHIAPGSTVYEAVQLSVELLKKQSIPEPEESTLHLLSSALGLSWDTGYRELREVMHMSFSTNVSVNHSSQQILTPDQITMYNSMLQRRLEHEPIQYIIGKWDFHHLTGLIIRKPMLCPRPETEELVELVLQDVRQLIKERQANGDKNKIRILDVGAGTGAIGIALAYEYPKDVQVVALDVLPEAVVLSNQNADKFLSPLMTGDHVSELYHAILCSANDFTNTPIEGRQEQHFDMNFDIVVSNPPYIPSSDMDGLSLDVLEYESREALCGGNDGLDIVRHIIHRLPEWMSSTSSRVKLCWMEVDDSHPKLLETLLAPGSMESKNYGVEWCESRQDFCGRDRFVRFRVV